MARDIKSRRDWEAITQQAMAIVLGYQTLVTLRQLFYRLVSSEFLPNTRYCYKQLSAHTAAARRDGWFPDLLDRTRNIHQHAWFESPSEALRDLADGYRLDRTAGQTESLYVGIEKVGQIEQLTSWFGHLGIPIIATAGYSSQTHVQQVKRHAQAQGRPAVLLYAGDFDPSGEDIARDFVDRTDCWEDVVRVALHGDQVERFDLPALLGKAADPRAAGFTQRHGRLVQVEVDALDPNTLRDLYQSAIQQYWNNEAYASVLAEEEAHRDHLRTLAETQT